MKEIELLREVKIRCLEEIIGRCGALPGSELKDVNINVAKVKDIIYTEINKIAEREFKRSF